MRMKAIMRSLVIGAVVAAPLAAFAGIDNSHHDMPYMTISSQKCSFCHSITGVSTQDAALGKVGNFCVTVCHLDGSGISGRTTVIPTSPGSYTTFTPNAAAVGTATYGQGTFGDTGPDTTVAILTAGHGMNQDTLGTVMGFAGEEAAIDTTYWPYTDSNVSQEMQCTSCHAIHDSTNPPFLNERIDLFCSRCHNDAIRTQTFGTPGNHPIGFTWAPAAANTRNRDLMNMSSAHINITATGVSDGDAAGALDAGTASWNLGGHLVDTASGLPAGEAAALYTPTFTCVSCHTVHQNGSATGEYGSTLTVGSDIGTVCYGCHTAEPGRSGMGHPIDFETPISDGHVGWTIPLAAGYSAINAVYQPGGTAPLCVTCHDVHGGAANRMAIRQIGGVTTYAATDSVCDTCHVGSFPDPDGANDMHHPGVLGVSPYPLYPAATSWLTQDGNGNLADGLSCQDCHVGDGTSAKNSTAHNW